MPQPTLGNHQIIQGNGTNVGTVISLQCPGKHKLVGSDMMCVMGPNSTYWTGDSYCQGKYTLRWQLIYKKWHILVTHL